MISAISRCMLILDALSMSPDGCKESELGTSLAIEKSAVSRILATLETDGYVLRDPISGVYSLSITFAALGLRHLDNVGVEGLCMPMMTDVARKTGELCQLALVERETLVYVAKVEGRERIRIHSLVGKTAALHATSAGKVWLASLPEERALRIALNAGLTMCTPKTITSVDELRNELRKVREQGFAITDEEFMRGSIGLGVPIQSLKDSSTVGALVLTVPAFRFPVQRQTECLPILKAVAKKIAMGGDTIFRYPRENNTLASAFPSEAWTGLRGSARG